MKFEPYLEMKKNRVLLMMVSVVFSWKMRNLVGEIFVVGKIVLANDVADLFLLLFQDVYSLQEVLGFETMQTAINY